MKETHWSCCLMSLEMTHYFSQQCWFLLYVTLSLVLPCWVKQMTMSSWLTSPLRRTGISSSPTSSSMLYTAEGMNTVDSVWEQKSNISVHSKCVHFIWVQSNQLSGKLNVINWVWSVKRNELSEMKKKRGEGFLHIKSYVTFSGKEKKIINTPACSLHTGTSDRSHYSSADVLSKKHHLLSYSSTDNIPGHADTQHNREDDRAGNWPGKWYRWMWKTLSLRKSRESFGRLGNLN